MTGAKEQLKNVTFVLCFNRLKMLQRPKKLRMSVVSFQDQETKSSHWDSHVIQPMFSSWQMWKNASSWILFARFNEPGSGDSEKGNSQDGLRLSGHLVNLVSPFRMGLWHFAHHNVHVLLACFFLSPDLLQALRRESCPKKVCFVVKVSLFSLL